MTSVLNIVGYLLNIKKIIRYLSEIQSSYPRGSSRHQESKEKISISLNFGSKPQSRIQITGTALV